jgi:hypothetical protein
MVRVDEEFSTLIPSLTPGEFEELERSILKEGCREALVVWGDIIVDGHNRYQICTKHNIPFKTVQVSFTNRDDVKIWIIINQFARRNLGAWQRSELALTLEPLIAARAKEHQQLSEGKGCQKSDNLKVEPIDTKHELATIAGVSHDTIAKVKKIKKKATSEQKQRVNRGETTINRVYKEVRQKEKEEAKKPNEVSVEILKDIIIGDFREKASSISNGSISLILTDPPYGTNKEVLQLLDGLAVFAADKLVEGGSLICYIGQTQLPYACEVFKKYLRYVWVMACIHSGSHGIMREYGINIGWKPILWFTKGSYLSGTNVVKDVVSGGEEKESHKWQQSVDESEAIISKLCPPDGVVCDPMMGSGTVAIACERLGRKWIGIEIDEQTASDASSRILKEGIIHG